MKQLNREEFLAQFDPEVHTAIITAAIKNRAIAVVMFENQQMDSGYFGERTALCVGLTCTYQTVADCEGKWLNDLPSQRQYPQTWISGLDLCDGSVTKL